MKELQRGIENFNQPQITLIHAEKNPLNPLNPRFKKTKTIMRKQIYLCVDLKTYTADAIQPRQARKGTLSMSEDQERFIFIENAHTPEYRSQKVYKGKRINVCFTRDCRFEVTLRKIHLTPDADPLLLADEIFTELSEAMKALGMQPARPVGRDL